MNKTFTELGFSVGDKVKVLNNDNGPHHHMKIGSIAEVVGHYCGRSVVLKGEITNNTKSQIVNLSCLEKVDDMYEDAWILNDGKVTIPDDAQKTMHEGSVVAFRLKKEKPLKFGDELIGRQTGNTYKYITGKNWLTLFAVKADEVRENLNPKNFYRK